MTPHPQANILRALADGEEIDALCGEEWCGVTPMAVLRYIYNGNIPLRIKPKVININGYEVPEPMWDAPTKGTVYWTAITPTDTDMAVQWDDHSSDKLWLSQGICHLSRESAALHREALLSFTQRE